MGKLDQMTLQAQRIEYVGEKIQAALVIDVPPGSMEVVVDERFDMAATQIAAAINFLILPEDRGQFRRAGQYVEWSEYVTWWDHFKDTHRFFRAAMVLGACAKPRKFHHREKILINATPSASHRKEVMYIKDPVLWPGDNG